jgi:hypothetical protein
MQIDGTKITFDLYDVLRNATPSQCADIADGLALNDAVRKCVIDSLIDGVSELGSSNGWHADDEDRKRILEARGELTDRRIAVLESDLRIERDKVRRLEAIERALWNWYHESGRGEVSLLSRRIRDVLEAKAPAA